MDTETVQTQAVAPVADAPGAQPTPTKPAVSATPQTQTVEDVAALPEWAQKAIRELRAESANHRKAKTAAETAAALASEQAAKEQGQWKQLAEQYEPKAKRADALEAYIAETLEAETANIPDKLKPLIPQGDALSTLRWVQQAKAAGILSAPQAPRTDAGAATNGAQPQKGLLTDERRQEIANKYGLRVQDVPQQIGR
jgi:hypothetical protein